MLFSLGSVCVFTADSINAPADKHSQLCCVKDSSVTPYGKRLFNGEIRNNYKFRIFKKI